MSLRPIGGIFWRPDASGNLTAYDTSGNVLAKFSQGQFSAAGNLATAIGTTPTTTNGTVTYVSTGIGVQITPKITGTILILIAAPVSNNTINDGVDIALFFDSAGGSVPAANAATTGVNRITNRFLSATANQEGVVAFPFHDTGLTVGSKVTYYMAYKADTGGTASFAPSGVSSAYITAQEI